MTDPLLRDAEIVHQRLLRLHEALARYNAAIRVKFPRSHPMARAMERNTSGWVNDAPFQIQEFVHAAEDALFSQLRSRGASSGACDIYLSEGVTEILDAARAWAGHTPIDAYARDVFPKCVTIVERGLFDLVDGRALKFFAAVRRLKLLGTSAADLIPAQQKFKRKLGAMEGTLKRARKDAEPTFRILLLMRAVVTAECATRIVQYIA